MKINVPEKYTDLYIKALQEKKNVLTSKINQFKMEIDEIDNHLNSLTSMSIFQENKTEYQKNWKTHNYQIAWSWTKKITYYQQFKNKIITTSEVVEFIIEKEAGLDKSKVRSSVSAALSNWVKKKQYLKFEDPVTGISYYGPSLLFINQNEPKIEFMPQDLKERLLYNK
ncbi:MAG: hypothetical protein OEW67_06710 [Cyclobacteriaceae bacterium]|nr:hypothetical protein [Cyclobacteriaceae bacterium]